MAQTIHIIKALRPQHWLKSIFVFTGLFYSHTWQEPTIALQVTALAVAFSLVASCVYLINDITDIDNDKHHPKKCNRPIACGLVSRRQALIAASVSYTIGFYIAIQISIISVHILLIYLLINLAYCAKLKHVPIIDILCVASGFFMRVLIGTVGVDIKPSIWLITCATVLSVMLAIGKRRAEYYLYGQGMETRPVLATYSQLGLNIALGTAALLTCIIYAMYTMSRHPSLSFTLPLTAACLLRYCYCVMQLNKGEDIINLLIQDKTLLGLTLFWFALTMLLI